MLSSSSSAAAVLPARLPPPTVRCGQRRQKQEEERGKLGGSAAAAVKIGGLGFGQGRGKKEEKKKKSSVAETWRCASGCGACCKLEKGPGFPTPAEIFSEDPAAAELYESMVGADGWCVHYDRAGRACTIYADRPYFCQAEPAVFERLFGIPAGDFQREACRSCRDTIKAVYGPRSAELRNFNRTVRTSSDDDGGAAAG